MVKIDNSILNEIATIHRQNGGSTFNLLYGNLIGKNGYALSVHPARERKVKGKILSARVIKNYLNKNKGLFRLRRNSLGTWFNKLDNKTYLDVSTTFRNRKLAIKLAARAKTKSHI